MDKLRLNDYIGQLCDKEMQDIEFGLMVSLGLDNYLSKPKEAPGTADIVGPVVIPDPAPVPVNNAVHAFSDGRKSLVQPAAPSEGGAFLRAGVYLCLRTARCLPGAVHEDDRAAEGVR